MVYALVAPISLKESNAASAGKSFRPSSVSASVCIGKGGDGKKQRGEWAGARLDLGRRNRLQYLADPFDTVLMGKPAPMREGPVVHKLDDDGLLVFVAVEMLKPIRPKERAEVIRQSVFCGWMVL